MMNDWAKVHMAVAPAIFATTRLSALNHRFSFWQRKNGVQSRLLPMSRFCGFKGDATRGIGRSSDGNVMP
jgi:hypothetical protein